MTKEDYTAQLELLRKIIPDNPLLERLQQYTRVNTIYLRELMAENVQPRERSAKIGTPKVDFTTEIYRKLQMRQSTLFKQRAKLSNAFHDYPDNQTERANISRAIRPIQLRIKAVMIEIEHYSLYGELPKEKVVVDDPVYDEAEAIKRRNAVNSAMTRTRASLRHPALDAQKRKELDEKLRKYVEERDELNRQIRQWRL